MRKLNIKTGLMVVVISLLATNLFAQGPYINLNIGSGIGTSSQNLSWFYNETRQNNFTTREQVNVSFGKGINIGGAFGYMFNENIGLEMGISYLFGGKTVSKDIYNNGTTDYTISSNMLRFNPSLVIAAGFKNINPYAKFGFLIGTGSIIYDYNDNDNGDVYFEKTKYSEGLAFGLTSGVGILFGINDKLSFFGEINMTNLSYAPNRGEIIESSNNGVDQLPFMTTKEKQTDFVDSYTTEQGNPSPDSQPNKQLIEKYPFSSIGLNIGLRINL